MFTGLLQPSHLIILAIIALVFLGPKRIPEAARSLGHAFREFKGSIGDHDDDTPEALTSAVHDGGDRRPESAPTATKPAHEATKPAHEEQRSPVALS